MQNKAARWGAAAVVTLVENAELDELHLWDLEKEVRRRFVEWHHLPIRDVSVADAAFKRSWPAHAARLQALLDAGANVLVHCRGGLGRAGMVAARLLVERGVDPETAMSEVRAVRAGAVETPNQEQWVRQGSKIQSLAPAANPMRSGTVPWALSSASPSAKSLSTNLAQVVGQPASTATLGEIIGAG